jgi:hypothetical protein
MSLDIGRFINIILNLIWARIWGRQADIDYWSNALQDWWNDFKWSLQVWVYSITDAINKELRSWEQFAVDVRNWAVKEFDSVYKWIERRWIDAQNFAIDQANRVIALLNQAIRTLNAAIAAVEAWIGDWLNHWIIPNVNWLLSQVTWLITYVVNTVIGWINWLLRYYQPLEWYVNQAMAAIHDFLLDPLGFVLRWLLPSVRYWYDIYTVYKDAMSDFVNLVLIDLVNLYNRYAPQIKWFLRDPQGWFKANVEDQFFDWVCRLIAERW